MLVRLGPSSSLVLYAMSGETRTFDFGDKPVSDSSFEDIESTADKLMVARGGSYSNRFARVKHLNDVKYLNHLSPWAKIGTLASVLGLIVAIVFGLISLF